MTGYLTIVGGIFLNGFIPTPTSSGILSNLRLRMSSGLSDNQHALNDSGYEIICAYMRLLSDKNPYIKIKLIQGWMKDIHSMGTNYARRAYYYSLETRWAIYRKERIYEIWHYLVAWKYNVWDAVVLPQGPCKQWSSTPKRSSDFRKCGQENGDKPWIDTNI